MLQNRNLEALRDSGREEQRISHIGGSAGEMQGVMVAEIDALEHQVPAPRFPSGLRHGKDVAPLRPEPCQVENCLLKSVEDELVGCFGAPVCFLQEWIWSPTRQ